MHTDTNTGAVTFTKSEVASMSRLLESCREKFGTTTSSDTGWNDTLITMKMWDDILHGHRTTLADYGVNGPGLKTVQQWIDRYGSDRIKSASTAHSTVQSTKK